MLNQRKYPASPLFLLMTLGPPIALLPLAERARGWLAAVLATFGRVPMFYYLLHIPLIHVARAGLADPRRTPRAEWFATAPYVSIPPEQRWGLPLLYLVFVVVVALLYCPCRWYTQVKDTAGSGRSGFCRANRALRGLGGIWLAGPAPAHDPQQRRRFHPVDP